MGFVAPINQIILSRHITEHIGALGLRRRKEKSPYGSSNVNGGHFKITISNFI